MKDLVVPLFLVVNLLCMASGWGWAFWLRVKLNGAREEGLDYLRRGLGAEKSRDYYMAELMSINRALMEELYGTDMRGETSMLASANNVKNAIQEARNQEKKKWEEQRGQEGR